MSPSHDDRHLYEMLTLEGAQAGLSWSTILRKREGYRSAFAGFDPAAVARFTEKDVERLLGDPGHRPEPSEGRVDDRKRRSRPRGPGERGKLRRVPLVVRRRRSDRQPVATLSELPAETDLSRALSKDLKRRGFRFVGPTACYAFMQTVGMVDDHTVDCFRRVS